MRVWVGVVLGGIVGNLAADLLRIVAPYHGASFWLVLLGLVGGGWLGSQWRARGAQPSPGGEAAALAERVVALEAQVDWLYRESLALRRALSEHGATGSAGIAVEVSSAATAAARSPTPSPAPSLAAEPPDAPRVAAAVPPVRPSEDTAPLAASAGAPAWWSWLLAGNPLAKIGVVLLFFGVASALRLAAEYGLMPVPLRLFLASAGGVALIAFGVRKAANPERRNFGLAVQGGGFALLYLVVYFMLARYAMLGAASAFGLFAALGVGCVLFAARQDGPALAVLGLAGAFIAPLLAGGRADSPLLLFSYFALLNAFILAVDWFRAWQVLNIAGFVFTLVIGMLWALDGYRPEHYGVTQFFLALFVGMYSAMPVAAAWFRAPGFAGWRHAMLVFGVPLAGAFLQSRLMAGVPYGLAWSALLAAIYYFGLWALLFRQRVAEAELIERSHLGLAIAFLTVSVPLAFGAQVTSAFWAAEGAAVLWFGVRQQRALAQATGLGMQALGGLALVAGWAELNLTVPVINDAVLGGALITAAGVASARLLRSLGKEAAVDPAAPFVWALGWWFATGLGELHRFAAHDHQAAYALLFSVATVVGIEALAAAWRWPQARRASVVLQPAMWLAAVLAVDRAGHPFAGLMLMALPLALAVNVFLVVRHLRAAGATEGSPAADEGLLLGVRHVGGWWLALLALPLELAWIGQQLAPGVSVWAWLAWGSVPAASLWLVAEGVRRNAWVFAVPALAVGTGALLPAGMLVLWSLLASVGHAGQGTGVPYLPLVNLYDLTQLAALGALWRSRLAFPRWQAVVPPVVAVLGFVWVSMLAGRMAHQWWGVTFTASALWRSPVFQAWLTLIWTVLSITTMIVATRARAGGLLASDPRRIWFAGFGLLAVVGSKLVLVDAAGAGTLAWTGTLLGVAALVLAAGYFAPLPPKPEVASSPSG